MTTTSISLDPDERRDDPAEPVDRAGCAGAARSRAPARKPTPRSASGMSATMISALKMTADRIALCGVAEAHDVERARAPGRRRANSAGTIAKYFATSLAMRERRDRAARDQQLLADRDDLEQLRRVRVEVDHVGRLLGRRRARCSSPGRRRPGRAPARRSCRRRSSRRGGPRPARARMKRDLVLGLGLARRSRRRRPRGRSSPPSAGCRR